MCNLLISLKYKSLSLVSAKVRHKEWSQWESGKYGAGQAGREHYKSRVMNVMHIDFFSLQKTETGRDEGFFSGRGGGRGAVTCSCKQYISLYQKNRAGWQQFWEVSITPCCNKALIWALDNVSAPCLCNTLNLAHLALAFFWFAVFRDTPLVTFLSHSLLKPFSSVNFLSLHHPACNILQNLKTV